jgi:hypothetical protein
LDCHHWHVRPPDDAFGHTAEQKSRESTPTVCRHYDQIHTALLGVIDNRLKGVTLKDFSDGFNPVSLGELGCLSNTFFAFFFENIYDVRLHSENTVDVRIGYVEEMQFGVVQAGDIDRVTEHIGRPLTYVNGEQNTVEHTLEFSGHP